MHRSHVAPVPRFAHAVAALADKYERGAYVLMEMMQAYERRVRSDCRTPEELAKRPWECREYLAADEFLRATWPAASPPPASAESKCRHLWDMYESWRYKWRCRWCGALGSGVPVQEIERPAVQPAVVHASDCAVHNEPYKPAGPCNCNLADDAPTVEQLIAISEQQK